jgi:transcriptional regulator with XRE-family HTH domain
MLSDIGDAIKTVRIIRRMSQREVALKSGLSEAYIGYIENGKRGLSWSSLVKISAALNCNVALVVFMTQSKEPEMGNLLPMVLHEIVRGSHAPQTTQ